jgi:Zn-dependent protease with chaperone function
MFALRLVGIALSVFILAYCLLSFAMSAGWKFVARLCQPLDPTRSANFLFGLRLFPLVAALGITAVYVVPSYLVWEPEHVDEPFGPMLLLLAGLAFSWLLAAGFRAAGAQKRTSRALSKWVQGAKGMQDGAPFPVLRLTQCDPVLTVAGIYAPRVLVSEAAAAVLTRQELDVALKHEMAHIRHHDNLKKLLLRVVGFPAMTALESAWLEMSEMAADDAAVSNPAEALDLASALIKFCRFAPIHPSYAIASALVNGAAASFTARLQRLFDWAAPPDRQTSSSATLPSMLVVGFLAVLTYAPMLAGVHALTEWLVR